MTMPSETGWTKGEDSQSQPIGGAPSELRGGEGEPSGPVECHGLDTPERVCFYEQDFYPLSNFSSFEVVWSGYTFKTAEHLYHWLRFTLSDEPEASQVAGVIKNARSAHEAFRTSQEHKPLQVEGWDQMKVQKMRMIIRAKTLQHEYVRRKLLATGGRELVENSWRDDFWGWGPNRDGQNVLGKLWMELRAELRAAESPPSPQGDKS